MESSGSRWEATPSQRLADQLAEADIAHRWAQIRDLEAKTADDSRKAAAESYLLEAQRQKLAGEVAQQPLEAKERRARIKETEARAEESEARTARTWLMVLLPSLLAVIAAITGAVDSGHLAGSGLETIIQKFIWSSVGTH